jgi:hypothetical protein
MSGINSRPRFDTCDIDNILAITVNPGKYTLSEDQISQQPFCINNTQRMSSRVGRVSALDHKNASSLVDIESHLHNLDTTLSNCSLNRTLDEKNQRAQALYNTLDMGVCAAEQLKTIYSKLDIDSNMFREATSHRFDFPIIPPSDFTYFGIDGTEQIGNNRDGINTRLQAKDRIRSRV